MPIFAITYHLIYEFQSKLNFANKWECHDFLEDSELMNTLTRLTTTWLNLTRQPQAGNGIHETRNGCARVQRFFWIHLKFSWKIILSMGKCYNQGRTAFASTNAGNASMTWLIGINILGNTFLAIFLFYNCSIITECVIIVDRKEWWRWG